MFLVSIQVIPMGAKTIIMSVSIFKFIASSIHYESSADYDCHYYYEYYEDMKT
jgi:hypothetical protein